MRLSPRKCVGLAFLMACGVGAVNACSAGQDQSGASSLGSGGGSTQHGSGAGGPGSGGGTGGVHLAGSTTGSSQGTGGSCAGVSEKATPKLQPADIIIAVDTSGSMDQEKNQVQQHLNDFATIITSAGIDVHVILVADTSVCIPTPLGSGSCNGADENLPNYRHVVQGVDSNNALQILLDTYPDYKPNLRAGATKTFAVVSDDNSDMSAADFTSMLLALDPPTFQGFKFDAIVSFEAPSVCGACLIPGNCASCTHKCCDKMQFCNPYSAAEGTVYKQLVTQTGGVIGDLCSQNFQPVFTDMATGIVQSSGIACDFDIPTPDAGTIDPNKVNVDFKPDNMADEPILNVPGGLADCGPAGGWYYDDPQNPTKIILCPATCNSIQGRPGEIHVEFGCDTKIQPPQ
jgi:hypothetical protein